MLRTKGNAMRLDSRLLRKNCVATQGTKLTTTVLIDADDKGKGWTSKITVECVQLDDTFDALLSLPDATEAKIAYPRVPTGDVDNAQKETKGTWTIALIRLTHQGKEVPASPVASPVAEVPTKKTKKNADKSPVPLSLADRVNPPIPASSNGDGK